ncbi:hypothetical protein EC957_000304 [Mortierella hygrophila]|uniref:Uncharacterized protein n=1 Tax=Mortierella hygrophila TaxID=979708 RepID=A0A9P6F694_9FUNG|nr:hypothetical protein EC957_000304 [Mortierella hygrophila]
MVHEAYFKRPAEYYRRTQWTYPDTLRIRGSVIPSVITDVIIITSFAATLLAVEKSNVLGRSLNVASVIVPALSVVVGLILAFRTNTAYDRFWEGRKLWASLDVQIRNFSRMVWVGVKDTPHVHDGGSSSSSGGSSPKRNLLHSHLLFGRSNSSLKTKGGANGNGSSSGVVESRIQNVSSSTLIDIDSPPTLQQQQVVPETHADDYEKLVCIRLLLAFAVSVKHHLRQEFGIRYFDLEGLLPKDYEPCAAYETAEARMEHDKALGDRQLHRHYNEDLWTIVSGNEDGQMSLPLEIAHGLSLWVIAQSRASQIESALVGNLFTSINSMTDIFTNMERIVFTPIPLAYSIHLRQVVYLYCLALPFTFLDVLGWLAVPLMCLVSFTLFGMEAIGREIENPFGKDENDLHMDEFCRDLKRELDYTINLKNTVPGCHL